MSEHYGMAIIPIRVCSPKTSVVGGDNVSNYILAAIRNDKFFTLNEWNDVIRKRLHAFNHKPFQKKNGSRATWFAEERQFLLSLPRDAFAEWKSAMANFNCHIEVFLDGERVCSHIRLYGKQGQYSTLEAHMPPKHQQYLMWDGERFHSWATKIGANIAAVIESILTRYKVEQQGYRACMAILETDS
jgi:hypothetical protein